MPKPGPAQVYRFSNVAGLVLYAGITQDFAQRWSYHSKQQVWWPSVSRAVVDFYASWAEASEVEDLSIATDRPVYNIGQGPLSVMHMAELTRLLRERKVPVGNDALETMAWELAGQLATYLHKST